MADPSTSKTISRRNTPQLALGHTVSGRSRMTRSRSHDISENDALEQDKRPQRQSNNKNSDKQPKTEGRANTNRKRATPQEPDLPTVSEYPTVITEAGSKAGEAALGDDQDQLSLPDPKAHGRVSGFSGTTARTSGSTEDFNDLALEDLAVLDALPDLSESTQRLLSVIVPAEISNKTLYKIRSQLQDKRSGLTRKANRFRVDLESCLRERSSTFLDASTNLPILFGKEVGDELLEQRPDSIFQAANLASLAQSLLLYPQQGREHFLEQLGLTFPVYFTNDGADTLELQLETRTQYAIMQLSYHVNQANFDHDLVLNRVFYSDDGDTLRGFNSTARNSKESKLTRKATLQRLQDMRRFWNEENSTSPIESLRHLYSWDEYVEKMMIWIQERYFNIQVEVEGLNLEEIVQNLKVAIQGIERSKQSSNNIVDAELNLGQVDLSGYVATSEAINHPAPPGSINPQSTKRGREVAGPEGLNVGSPRLRHGSKTMKRLNSRLLASTASQASNLNRHSLAGTISGETSTAKPAVQITTPHQPAAKQAPSSAPAKFPLDTLALEGLNQDIDDDWRPQEEDDQRDDDEDGEEDAFQTQNADNVLRLRAQRQAENNKENQAESLQGQARKSLIDRQAGAERVAWGDSQELSQDVGFQQPLHPSPRRQALQPLGKRNASEPLVRIDGSPRKRARFQSALLEDDDDEDDARAPRAVPRPSQTYGIANETARQITAAQFKAPQTRKPWSEDEVNTLFDLIERCGTSWALLKAEDKDRNFILRNRDQVALKDKARNIKFDFLKAGRRLPRNFDRIALSKPMIDKLEGMNITYDRITGRREDGEE